MKLIGRRATAADETRPAPAAGHSPVDCLPLSLGRIQFRAGLLTLSKGTTCCT